MKIVITGLMLLIISLGARASSIDLVCTSKNGFSIMLQIDEYANSVTVNTDEQAEAVRITKDTISFFNSTGGAKWYHRINRTTGILMVTNENAELDSTYNCVQSNSKF